MEHQIRILNDHDRQTLFWLRTHVGDVRLSSAVDALARSESKPYVSALCRYLGVRPPVFSSPQLRAPVNSKVGDSYLNEIRTHLARTIHSCAR